jgi:hypothetical protein
MDHEKRRVEFTSAQFRLLRIELRYMGFLDTHRPELDGDQAGDLLRFAETLPMNSTAAVASREAIIRKLEWARKPAEPKPLAQVLGG